MTPPPSAEELRFAAKTAKEIAADISSANKKDPKGAHRTALILGVMFIAVAGAWATWGAPWSSVRKEALSDMLTKKDLMQRDADRNPARDDTLQAIKLAIEASSAATAAKIDGMRDKVDSVVKVVDEVKAEQLRLRERIDTTTREARERLDRYIDAVKKDK